MRNKEEMAPEQHQGSPILISNTAERYLVDMNADRDIEAIQITEGKVKKIYSLFYLTY